ncbi:hypothetical protein ECTOBSL9_1234 [Ectothiorhodospira sp. BSL-9]|nr:hypothetical protein ECTOBSL9_1234 [Ectothiorhodospira sp. BSL-9]
MELLEQTWVRSLFEAFCAWEELRKEAGNMTARIDRYAVFFAEIDRHCMAPGEVTQSHLFNIFGAERLRRGFLIVSFLCERLEIEWDAGALEDMIETKRIRLQAQSWQDRPWALDLQRFVEELQHRKGPSLKRKTIRMYQTAAGGLLETSGVNSPGELTQAGLQRYLKRHPGQAANLSAFVRYLREGSGVLLDLRYKPQASLLKKDRKLVEHVQAMVKQLEAETNELRAKALLVGLLAALYRVPAKEILTLTENDVLEDSEGFLLWPKNYELRVEGRLAKLLKRWVPSSTEGVNGFLFKGRNKVQPLTQDAVRHHLSISSKEVTD